MINSTDTQRDSWKTNWGFILSCIGSAVGMGNIWMFPTRVSKYGGGTFLLPYFLFVILIGLSGVIGEKDGVWEKPSDISRFWAPLPWLSDTLSSWAGSFATAPVP